MRSWYLIQTKPRQEKIAEQHLSNQGYRVYLPIVNQIKQCQAGWISSAQPLFPGYLFIQLMASQDDWRPIRSTRGVAKLVSFAGEPAVVPEAVMQALLCMDKTLAEAQCNHFPQQGDAIEVRVGEGFVQAIMQQTDGQNRVWVLLELLGRQQRLSVPNNAVRKVA